MKMHYTRDELIAICEKAFVPQDKWMDRDSCQAQKQLGSCYALLKAGCKFEILVEPEEFRTNEKTIWLSISAKNFQWYDLLDGDEEEFPDGTFDSNFYLPTEKTLVELNGGDWT